METDHELSFELFVEVGNNGNVITFGGLFIEDHDISWTLICQFLCT